MTRQSDNVHEMLSGLSRLSSDFAFEARTTLEKFDRDFICQGKVVPDELIGIWRLRVQSWKKLLRTYAETAQLEPLDQEAVDGYVVTLLRYAEALEPE